MTVAQLCQAHGWDILALDVRSPYGQLDALARHGDELLAIIYRPHARQPLQPGGRRMREAHRQVAYWIGTQPPRRWARVRIIDSATTAGDVA